MSVLGEPINGLLCGRRLKAERPEEPMRELGRLAAALANDAPATVRKLRREPVRSLGPMRLFTGRDDCLRVLYDRRSFAVAPYLTTATSVIGPVARRLLDGPAPADGGGAAMTADRPMAWPDAWRLAIGRSGASLAPDAKTCQRWADALYLGLFCNLDHAPQRRHAAVTAWSEIRDWAEARACAKVPARADDMCRDLVGEIAPAAYALATGPVEADAVGARPVSVRVARRALTLGSEAIQKGALVATLNAGPDLASHALTAEIRPLSAGLAAPSPTACVAGVHASMRGEESAGRALIS